MPFDDRKKLIEKIESARGGRRLVALCNFDRAESPSLGAMTMKFAEDVKEPLYRVLKETASNGEKLDVFLYTRGGATNAVWPIVSMLREFDADFEVLIPYRAHSSGTLLVLAARKIVMTPLAELSPIDPTTGNQFNPSDASNPQVKLGIGVEDVKAYQDFWRQALSLPLDELTTDEQRTALAPYLARLSTELHPLALGNVHRVHQQTTQLAKMLLRHHPEYDNDQLDEIVEKLTTRYYSHHHMINRHEAVDILDADHVEFADDTLTPLLDALLRRYEVDFKLRHPFFLNRFIADESEKEARFIGGVVESVHWGYLHETKMTIQQFVTPPPNVSIQVPPGETPPLVAGLPRQINWQISECGWVRNEKPQGVTT